MSNKAVANASFTPTLVVGASLPKQLLWYCINSICFKSGWFFSSGIKCFLLRAFGATIGEGVVIKPCINIKYPWKLRIGDHSWIGEQVWIDNLAAVDIGANVCISQGAYLLTGNHNYKSSSFNLITGAILIENGVWIGAKAIVCPGVVCKSHAVLSVASVASTTLEPYTIYRGNPALPTGVRVIE